MVAGGALVAHRAQSAYVAVSEGAVARLTDSNDGPSFAALIIVRDLYWKESNMVRAENGLAIPERLSDETALDVAFEGRFGEYFRPLGIATVGDLRQVPKQDLSFDAFRALDNWLMRCWWYW